MTGTQRLAQGEQCGAAGCGEPLTRAVPREMGHWAVKPHPVACAFVSRCVHRDQSHSAVQAAGSQKRTVRSDGDPEHCRRTHIECRGTGRPARTARTACAARTARTARTACAARTARAARLESLRSLAYGSGSRHRLMVQLTDATIRSDGESAPGVAAMQRCMPASGEWLPPSAPMAARCWRLAGGASAARTSVRARRERGWLDRA